MEVEVDCRVMYTWGTALCAWLLLLRYTEKQQTYIDRWKEVSGKFERLSREVDIVKGKGTTYCCHIFCHAQTAPK